jgi:hypothetical protein
MADKFVDFDGVGWKYLSHPGLASGLWGPLEPSLPQ